MRVVEELSFSMRSQKEQGTVLIHVVFVVELRRTFDFTVSEGRSLAAHAHTVSSSTVAHDSSVKSAIVSVLDDMNLVLIYKSTGALRAKPFVSGVSRVSTVH